MLHLQWLIPDRNQLKQAWYRCREWLDGASSAADINELYAVDVSGAASADDRRCRPSGSPTSRSRTVGDREPSWHQRELLAWFDAARHRAFRAAGDLAHPGCCATSSAAASDARRDRIARICRPGPRARGSSGAASCSAAAPASAGLTWRARFSRSSRRRCPATARRLYQNARRRVRRIVKPGRPAAGGVAVPGTLRARPQRRRRPAGDRRGLQLQPGRAERGRARRLRAGQRGAAQAAER